VTGELTETAELLRAITKFLCKYVVLPGRAETVAIALWTAHTWAIDAAHQTPYLLVLSPEKRSGKTRLLEVLELLVAAPWRITSTSEAAMFRKIAASKPTLLLDEVDAIFGSNSERTEPLRAILNSGNRPGASVVRCVGEGVKRVEEFSVFCPKVLAGIDTGRLPDTIRDRSVTLHMKRKTPGETVERFRVRFADEEALELREFAENWAERHVDALRDAVPELPKQLDDRAAEAWEALLAIADAAGGAWPAAAREAAVRLAAGEDEEASYSAKALAGARAAFNGTTAMSSAELAAALNGDDELPFGGWHDGKGVNARDLARLLKPYAIRPRTVRVDGATPKGYLREQFTDAWRRYLTDEDPPHATKTTHETADEHGDVAAVADVADFSGGAPEDVDVDYLESVAARNQEALTSRYTPPSQGCRCIRPLVLDEPGTCSSCGREVTV
jgi:hypothetical protein